MASRQPTRRGQSTQEPRTEPTATAKGRAFSVHARVARFQRAEIVFTPTPTIVRESEIGPERMSRILAEPALVCEPVE